MKTCKLIHVFGASGSGSTTLARAISEHFSYHFVDTDDAIWKKTDPPFTVRASRTAAISYLEQAITDHDKVVISGAFVGWGDQFKPMIDLFIYLNLPLPIRLERIKKREFHRFGSRILPGGDMHQQHLAFLEWVSQYDNGDPSMRSRKQHELWLSDIHQPIIRINTESTIPQLIEYIRPYLALTDDVYKEHL